MNQTVRVADVIVDFIYKLGVDTVFTLTGGGAMFLNDAVAAHPEMQAVCNHHEQACAMAAVGYAKLRNGYASAIVTTGCGATNAVTGLLDAWQDNVPCIFVSGQVKRKETCHNTTVPLRQFGVQEADIIPVVKSLTKYAVMINDPQEILFELEKAAFLAKTGRPGPVWIDVPLDVQGASVEMQQLRHYVPESDLAVIPAPSQDDMAALMDKLAKAKRPIIIAGNGIRLGAAIEPFMAFVEHSKIPVAVSYLGVDLLPSQHSQYVGRLGVKGDRAGNFAVQNADLVISVGCHLSVALTGFEYDLFAREAELVVVDIDADEHRKNTVKIDQFIHADVKTFFSKLSYPMPMESWISWGINCRKWRDQWPVCLPSYTEGKDGINKYSFMDKLKDHLKPDTVVVSDAGSSYYVTSQALKIRDQQRYVTSGAQADMGFTLPAAIGACVAKAGGEVVGITGDGSLQMNIQELQTLVHHQFPVKLVVWNNNGYLSIRATQRKFFAGRELGTDPKSGVSFPSTEKISAAYGIPFCRVSELALLDDALIKLMTCVGPMILEVMCPTNQEIIPTASSKKMPDGRMVSKPLEDMYPFLEREEFLANMIIKPLDE
ncbi:MAG: thiamine pyrophosphate-binding protein [Gallionella sp.]|nr:thiamine pyrophosphate-binding protein [Gallionella sp.]